MASTTNEVKLFNLSKFCRETRKYIKIRQEKFAIVLASLNNFDILKDMYGTRIINRLLRKLYSSLNEMVNTSFIYAGYLEDGCFVFLNHLEEIEKNEVNIYEYFEQTLKQVAPRYTIPFNMSFCELEPGISIMKCIDYAYLVINNIRLDDKLHYAWYDNEMKQKMYEFNEISSEMHNALKNGQFVPYFQPQFDYITGKIIGAEALVRWIHPKKGVISPNLFIPVFEKNGFIYDLDSFMVDKVCQYTSEWKKSGIDVPAISVNISRRDMYSTRLVSTIVNLIKKHELEPKDIHLEITESAYVENPQLIKDVIASLKNEGFFVEMDDFGSGYSSLLSLKDLPFDLIKLDMAFLRESKEVGKSGQILSSIVHMAHSIDLNILAEGVEEKKQADFLKSLGCRFMQGYFFSKPLPADEFYELISNNDISHKDLDNIVDDSVNFLDVRMQEALLFNSFVGGAIIIEYRGNKVYLLRSNDQFYEDLGITRQQWSLSTFTEKIGEQQYIKFKNVLQEAITTKKEKDITIYSKLHNEQKWVHARVRFLAKKIDSYIFYCATENITKHQLLIQKNNELMESLNSVVNNVPCGIIKCEIVDNKIKVLYMNDGYATMRGFQTTELMNILNTDINSDIYCDDVNKVKKAVDKSICDKKGFHMYIRVVKKNHNLMWINFSVKIYENFLYAFCEDLSDNDSFRYMY